MRCPNCGHENREGAIFCDQCAAELGAVCPSCQTQNEPGARFCRQCRESLETASSPLAHTPTPAPALPASFASGRYQVRRFIGEGGMKRVYLAHDGNLNRDVAIALIKSEGLTEEGIARIQREGQAMGQLGGHPAAIRTSSPRTTLVRRQGSTTSSWSTWREANWKRFCKATTARGCS